ncbi:AraC-like DNA-binding protein [Pseudomonas cedrina]|nr:AraC-like DNA-binding protein [Pseudomonas cedrina]
MWELSSPSEAAKAAALLAFGRLTHRFRSLAKARQLPQGDWSTESCVDTHADWGRTAGPGHAFNLGQSRLSLLDIAAQVGYQSQAAFSKKFKETYGEAPGRLREK